MTENRKVALKLKSGGTKFLGKDNKPDAVAQKKHDDDLAARRKADKALIAKKAKEAEESKNKPGA